MAQFSTVSKTSDRHSNPNATVNIFFSLLSIAIQVGVGPYSWKVNLTRMEWLPHLKRERPAAQEERMIGCRVLVDVYFLRLSCGPGSRVQVVLYLAGVFCLAVASYSCGQILWSSFYFLRSLLRFLRFLAVVFDFLQSWGSCGRQVLATVGLLHFPLASAIADFSLASVGYWLLSQHGWLLVLCLLSCLRLVAMFVTVAFAGLPMLAACYRLFFVPLFLPPPILLLSWPVIVALKNVY